MRILFVNPQDFNLPYGSNENIFIKHGIAQLSACLKKDGHIVELADLRIMKNWHDYKNILSIFHPDFVCITVMTSDLGQAILTAKLTKKYDGRIITVAGGIHASIAPEDLVNNGYFDYVMRGEGELSLPILVESPENFDRLFYGETPDLSDLPYEDRWLWQDYEKRIGISVWGFETPVVDMIKSRGCPYHCKFCCGPGEQNHYTHMVNGKRKPFIRSRSVEHVIGEITQLYDRYKFKSVIFHDDQFILNKNWTWEFCQEIKEKGLVDNGVKWWAASRADIILDNKDLIKEMRDCGLSIMSIGLESFSNHLLSFWDKGTTVDMNYEAAEYVKSLGIKLYSNLIMGAPREDGKWYIEDDIANVEAVKRLCPDIRAYSFFTPMPGSALFDWAKENGLTIGNNIGDRSATEPKIRGVDYKRISQLLNPEPPGMKNPVTRLYNTSRYFLRKASKKL